jgi:hypothetical protein
MYPNQPKADRRLSKKSELLQMINKINILEKKSGYLLYLQRTKGHKIAFTATHLQD